jgi:hypothetical protein
VIVLDNLVSIINSLDVAFAFKQCIDPWNKYFVYCIDPYFI